MENSMATPARDSTVSSDRVKAREERLHGFSAEMWLRGKRSAEAEDRPFTAATLELLPTHADFVFEPPRLTTPKVSAFLPEQEFEGVVLSLDRDNKTFWARLADRTADTPDEEAEFPLDEVSSDDWSLIVPGALFSWNIGREWRDGQMRRVSEIRFRRFFQFSKAAVARSEQRAAALASLIAELDAYPTNDAAQGK